MFCILGLVRVVNVLYEYYCCVEGDKDEIVSMIWCLNLLSYIKVGMYDVVLMFKWLLVGLLGGILGSLVLFDVLVVIYS